MTTILRALRSLALTFWIGGIAFFALAVAPVAFHVLPTAHQAGLIVSSTIRILHWIGLIAAPLILLTTLLLRTKSGAQSRASLVALLLTLGMLALTAWSQFGILPRMEHDRQQAGGAIEQADLNNPARLDFDRLHHLSEQVEGAVLLGGLVLIVLSAAEPATPRSL